MRKVNDKKTVQGRKIIMAFTIRARVSNRLLKIIGAGYTEVWIFVVYLNGGSQNNFCHAPFKFNINHMNFMFSPHLPIFSVADKQISAKLCHVNFIKTHLVTFVTELLH